MNSSKVKVSKRRHAPHLVELSVVVTERQSVAISIPVDAIDEVIDQLRQFKSSAEPERKVEWVSMEDRKPDVLKVRIKLTDGSELNAWTQSDGDFYWKRLNTFIDEFYVTHWRPSAAPQQEQNNENND